MDIGQNCFTHEFWAENQSDSNTKALHSFSEAVKPEINDRNAWVLAILHPVSFALVLNQNENVSVWIILSISLSCSK